MVEGGGTRLTTRLIEGEYPNYRNLLPSSYPNTLTVGREALLEALARVPIQKYVYSSSSSVYGNDVPLPMREDAYLQPLSPYGVTKLAADATLRADGRSSDGAWWRVSLDGGRTGYIHRTAVTKNRVVAKKPPAAEPAPV